MIKLLEGVVDVGEEIKCKECGSVIHCEEHDWQLVSYFYREEKVINYSIDCPKCYCRIYKFEDI